ncbi:MAG: hypothetical protein KGR25_00100 [Chloroflexi bacterium]|nr:hypothetical protein [Chloroflexota bacterium]
MKKYAVIVTPKDRLVAVEVEHLCKLPAANGYEWSGIRKCYIVSTHETMEDAIKEMKAANLVR